jgi:hypothetical protein
MVPVRTPGRAGKESHAQQDRDSVGPGVFGRSLANPGSLAMRGRLRTDGVRPTGRRSADHLCPLSVGPHALRGCTSAPAGATRVCASAATEASISTGHASAALDSTTLAATGRQGAERRCTSSASSAAGAHGPEHAVAPGSGSSGAPRGDGLGRCSSPDERSGYSGLSGSGTAPGLAFHLSTADDRAGTPAPDRGRPCCHRVRGCLPGPGRGQPLDGGSSLNSSTQTGKWAGFPIRPTFPLAGSYLERFTHPCAVGFCWSSGFSRLKPGLQQKRNQRPLGKPIQASQGQLGSVAWTRTTCRALRTR